MRSMHLIPYKCMPRFVKSNRSKAYLLILAHLGALITVSAWACSFLSSKVLMENGGWTPVETYI